jgi:hypothetical protein
VDHPFHCPGCAGDFGHSGVMHSVLNLPFDKPFFQWSACKFHCFLNFFHPWRSVDPDQMAKWLALVVSGFQLEVDGLRLLQGFGYSRGLEYACLHRPLYSSAPSSCSKLYKFIQGLCGVSLLRGYLISPCSRAHTST